jgi:hypothetical protein
MAIAAGLSATKTGFKLIKIAVELLKRETVDVHEVQARLIELQGLMLDARSALVDAEEENRRLKRALEDQDDAKKLAEDMEFQNDGGFYVRKSEAGKGLIAYCPLCCHSKPCVRPGPSSVLFTRRSMRRLNTGRPQRGERSPALHPGIGGPSQTSRSSPRKRSPRLEAIHRDFLPELAAFCSSAERP